MESSIAILTFFTVTNFRLEFGLTSRDKRASHWGVTSERSAGRWSLMRRANRESKFTYTRENSLLPLFLVYFSSKKTFFSSRRGREREREEQLATSNCSLVSSLGPLARRHPATFELRCMRATVSLMISRRISTEVGKFVGQQVR